MFAKRTQKLILAAVSLCVILSVGIATRARIVKIQQLAKQGDCATNLKQIALALWSYQDKYGSLPPACIKDADGKPLHSWRVLILPFLDGENVYAQYDFEEPWNGPKNSRLQGSLPPSFADRFHCPMGRSPQGTTNYFAVIGPETLWPGSKPSCIVDDMKQARPEVLVIEMPDSEVSWLEPVDFGVDEVISKLESLQGERRSIHPRGIQYVDTAQRIHAFPTDFGALVLRKLMTNASCDPAVEPNDR